MAVLTAKNKTKHLVIIFLTISAFFAAGCAGMDRRVTPPRVSLVDIQVREIKVLEAVFQVDLRVVNTSDVSFKVRGIDLNIELNDRKFASGVSRVSKKLPAYETETFPIVVYSSALDVARGLLGLSGQDEIRYKITGKMNVRGKVFGASSVPFSSEGVLAAGREEKKQ
jgi:LEA14-like dessication related protein